MKTVKFYTLGCKANQYDTQSIREQFMRAGFQESGNSHPADICVINTCTVTQRADSESLGLMRRAARVNPGARIIVTGCFSELEPATIKKAQPRCLIVKNKDKNKILTLLIKKYSSFLTHNSSLITSFKGHTRAFLKIQDGCDNLCSYCRVPFARGLSRSKALSSVVREARQLVKNGFREIVLTGICLGSFGQDLRPRLSLVDAIGALESIDGLSRIRLSSIEAGDVSDELIEKMAHSKKLCRHFHIPIQSGDDMILKKMHRKYLGEDYLRLIKRIKKRIPGVAITTDVLVGFPGESEDAFKNTVELVKRISPLRVHIFPYSARPATAAAALKNKISPQIIKERELRLKDIAYKCSLFYQRRFLKKIMDVLIEGRDKQNPLAWEGHTDNYIKVKVRAGQNLKGRIIPVRLEKTVDDYVSANIR
jgi:threonylcarbamoyladenosine tRNA methylthiotransferase MtaB